MSEPPREIDPARIRTIPVARRPNKVTAREFARPPGSDPSFEAFLDSLPDILQARSFLAVVDALVETARANGTPGDVSPGRASGPSDVAAADRPGGRVERAGVCMFGGHIVKTGLAPLLIELMEAGAITHLASNGSAVIHDYEMARFGGTSEDVEAGLADGSFGMAEETGRGMNEAITRGAREGWGLGEALARDLAGRDDLARPELSLLLAARRLGVGFTVHAAIGAEITHQHPVAHGAAIGATSMTDFRRLAAHLDRLDHGIVLNLGSAVIMPEVFLKALTICRNLNDGRPRAFTAADFDMNRHYRPRVNVVERPTRTGGGQGYQITGHHEIMVPLLAWAVLERLRSDPAGSSSRLRPRS